MAATYVLVHHLYVFLLHDSGDYGLSAAQYTVLPKRKRK